MNLQKWVEEVCTDRVEFMPAELGNLVVSHRVSYNVALERAAEGNHLNLIYMMREKLHCPDGKTLAIKICSEGVMDQIVRLKPLQQGVIHTAMLTPGQRPFVVASGEVVSSQSKSAHRAHMNHEIRKKRHTRRWHFYAPSR